MEEQGLYNLKRKVAGLPPVSREWYDARKSQLLGSLDTSAKRMWQDPLTGKKFSSENTYEAYTRSKKYLDLVKKSGQPQPQPVITISKAAPPSEPVSSAATGPSQPKPLQGHVTKPIARPAAPVDGEAGDDDEYESGSQSGAESDAWETDDGSEAGAGPEAMEKGNWEDWDLRRSFFDGHVSASMEANLAYMFQKFGFYLPDSEFLVDPEGLLKYLGAKIQYGHVPLYESGDNPNSKQFRSLHARHMVDTVQCKLLYEENEDEYADFYDYAGEESDVDAGVLALGTEEGGSAASGFELGVPLAGGGTRYLGTREFARYYRQRHRHDKRAALTAAAKVLAEYRRMAVPLLALRTPEQVEKRRAVRVQQKHWARQSLALGMARNINDKLPKNVPY